MIHSQRWNISIDQGSECIRTSLVTTKPFVWRQSVLIQLSLLSQTAWTSVPHVRSLSHICVNRCYQHGDKSSPGRWRSSSLALLSLHSAVHHTTSAWRCIGWAAVCSFVMLLVFLWEWSESWLWHRRILCLSPAKGKQKEKVISLDAQMHLPHLPLSDALCYNDSFQQQAMWMYEPDETNMKIKLFHTHEPSLWFRKYHQYGQRVHLVIGVQVFTFSVLLKIDLHN